MREMLAAMHEPSAVAPATLVPAGCRRVRFRGERGGDGPLTTGQSNTLAWVGDTSAYARMVQWALDLPPGTTLGDIEAAFSVLMARHESLRTTCPPVEPPIQRVARSGELIIGLYQAADENNDSLALTKALTETLRSGEFDLVEDLPVRVGVAISERGIPLAAVVVCSHMAADIGAMAVIGREFTELAGNPASREAGPPRHQPLDQAAVERSPRGQQAARTALRNWESQLRSMPQCLYSAPRRGPAGEPVAGWLWSEAAARALPYICERTSASPQTVVLAAVSAVLSIRTAEARCSFTTLMHNRHERRLRDYVGTIACDTIICVDTSVPRFGDLVRRTGRTILKAAKGGFVSGAELARLVSSVEHERGIPYSRDCVYNDFSYVNSGPSPVTGSRAPAGRAQDAATALSRTELRWTREAGGTGHLVAIFLGRVEDEMILGAATPAPDRVPPGDLEMILRGVERLLVASAPGDVSMDEAGKISGVTPLQRGPGWLRAGCCWAEMAEVQRLVDDALDVPAARVFAAGSPEGNVLVAYLAAGNGVHTPEQAHAACLAALRQGEGSGKHYTAITPASYVVCAQPPSDPADLPSWQRQLVLAHGSGRV
jgi:Condensation domain